MNGCCNLTPQRRVMVVKLIILMKAKLHLFYLAAINIIMILPGCDADTVIEPDRLFSMPAKKIFPIYR
ncbi:MAG: hypothetical protein JWQ14_1704, partial [Adhaeribacter sp.]|nr:hypothetical protein [Adhaeribacter sp.]